ncbi:MAG: carbohydrate binding family 9 domain-containing protein, partial [Saprospiraceae bacterium]|nr:carbohydrate binding family 9 domain-containing protein [Saprospiraceae bacterium]
MKTQQGTVIGLVVPLFFSLTLRGQEPKSILVRTTKEPIHIDGVMDEPAWQRADTITDFWLWFPDDTSRAKYQTQIFMLRDAKNIYVAAKCFAVGDDYIIPGLRRDFRAGGNDNVSLLFDTFNDETNAFLFGLNPLGVQREALISSGGLELENFATAWDNVWEGDAKIYEGYYLCEFSIPFRTLRYNEGINEWNFNSYRFDAQYNEQSTWNRIPRNQWIFSLAHMGKIIWEDPLPKSGANISLIPYVRGGVSKDQPGAALSTEGSIGMDAKVAVTPGLNLDLTVNPDFSQVEVDQQLTNLTRFELSLPEQRQFFTENSDLFGAFGNARINPFFSRRIGVAIDTLTGFPVQNPIWYGARLSGKISNPLRVGLLNLQTAAVGASGIPSSNYTTAVVQHKVFSRSNVGLIFVNKQDFGKDRDAEADYNRVVGAEYNLASANNEWNGKVFLQRSFVPGEQLQPYAHGGRLNFIGRHLNATWEHEWVGSDYTARVGFV